MKLEDLKIKTTNHETTIYMRELTIYISYETIIGIDYKGTTYISENHWGPTTGKFINSIDRDKSHRIPRDQFEDILKQFDISIDFTQ